MKTTLEQLAVGEVGRVTGYIKGPSVYRDKLMALGLTRGTEISVTRIAPLGDPVEIKVRGFALSLRKEEASTLIVERKGH